QPISRTSPQVLSTGRKRTGVATTTETAPLARNQDKPRRHKHTRHPFWKPQKGRRPTPAHKAQLEKLEH
ncbi:hypothetical protein Taro_028891, partial [Colocasia esculenta]|nr:hypothetical protein [Colocasia esculenta]